MKIVTSSIISLCLSNSIKLTVFRWKQNIYILGFKESGRPSEDEGVTQSPQRRSNLASQPCNMLAFPTDESVARTANQRPRRPQGDTESVCNCLLQRHRQQKCLSCLTTTPKRKSIRCQTHEKNRVPVRWGVVSNRTREQWGRKDKPHLRKRQQICTGDKTLGAPVEPETWGKKKSLQLEFSQATASKSEHDRSSSSSLGLKKKKNQGENIFPAGENRRPRPNM